MQVKRGFVVLLFVILLLGFVLAQDATAGDEEKDATKTAGTSAVPDIKDLVKRFAEFSRDENLGKRLSGSLNGLTIEKKKEFFSELASSSGVDSLKGLGEKVKEFDSKGNVVLEGGGKIELSSLYNYAKSEKKEVPYDFRGGSYKGSSPEVKEVKVEGDRVIYEFSNGASLSTKGDSSFDFKNRKISSGVKTIEWVNMDGGVVVDNGKIDLNVNFDESGETDLKDFPVLKTEDGEAVSPYHEGRKDTSLPKDFKVPGKGNFKFFKKDGKTFSVDSGGGVREMKSSTISLNEKGEVDLASDVMVEKKEVGEFFTQKDTYIFRGESPQTDLVKSFIWTGGKDGKKNEVFINLVGSKKMYFNSKKDLASLELNGEVVVKNGGYFLVSTPDGNIAIRKIKGGDGKMEFKIDKLYSTKKKDEFYVLKEYVGEENEFKGKIMVHNKEGKLVLGGVVATLSGVKKTSAVKGVGNSGSKTLDDIESMMPEGHEYKYNKDNDKTTWAHETVHGLNSKLRNRHGDGVNAFYLLNGEYVVLNEPKGVKISDVANEIPAELRGMSYDSYLVKSRGDWDNQPLYILDEFSAYSHGSRTRAELGIANRGESVQQMMEFVGYSVAILNKAPDDPALKSYVKNRIQNAMEVYKMNQNVGGATSQINKLKSNSWFVSSANKHFGEGWVESTLKP